jgi:hypothetical protein
MVNSKKLMPALTKSTRTTIFPQWNMNAHPADPTVDMVVVVVAVEVTVEVAAVEDIAEIAVIPAEIAVDATNNTQIQLEALSFHEMK